MLVKCKFLGENGAPRGREYTYSAYEDIEVGEIVTTPDNKKVVVTETNVSLEAVRGFEDKIKGVLRVIDDDSDPIETADFDEQSLIVVEQLPIIKEQFRIAGEEVKRRVAAADALVCTEENKQVVKKERAQLRKELAAFNERFKAVESEVLAPWNSVKESYKEFISEPYSSGDERLKAKIDTIEVEQKQQKQKEVKAYFAEYAKSKHIDLATWERTGIKVGLSDNLTALKRQAKEFVDRIESDLQLIETQEHKEEILVDYKQNLNVSTAITAVKARHKAIEEQKARQAEIEARKAAECETVKRVEAAIPAPLAPPVAEKPVDDPVKTLAFKVTAPLSKLRELKKFLDDRGYLYE